MNDSNLVQYRADEGVAYLTLDNPPVNIMTGALMETMTELLTRAADDKEIKAVAITAQGKAFCAGADVGEHRPENVRGMIDSFGRLFRRLDTMPVPVVMAATGAVMGAGFELVLLADVLLAAEEAVFGQPEIRLGFFAPVGVAVLPRLVGRARAMEITCSGRSYTAAEMKDLGLVSRIVPATELETALEKELSAFRKASPLVMRLNTTVLKRCRDLDFAAAMDETERVFLDELMTSEDPVEGIEAFYAKRRPEWRNR